jgi:hypothetical protein
VTRTIHNLILLINSDSNKMEYIPMCVQWLVNWTSK